MVDAQQSLRELVVANQILAHEGILDTFGHVSVRAPEAPDSFYIARAIGPELVTEGDLQRYGIADFSRELNGDSRPGYAERAIHAAVYAARPDVHAACHNHAPSTIPFGVAGVPLRPIVHVAAIMGAEVPVWDPGDEFGETDMLVRSADQGASLARTLGHGRTLLMRGHGCVVVGSTLKEVVMCAVNMELNARLQLNALALGGTMRYLSRGEVELATTAHLPAVIQERVWSTLARRVQLAE